MLLLNSLDIDSDFWKSNPEARIFFAEEYKKKIPSKTMWALALYTHPESKLFNESPSVRRKLITTDFLKEPSFNFDAYVGTIKKFQEHCLSKPQRLLVNWEQKLHERDEFIASLSYGAETFDVLDKMIEKTPKLWDQYFKILELINKESDQKTRGDEEESLSDSGVI